MILRSFASNQPYTLIAIPVTVAVALVPAAMHQGLPLMDAGFPADELLRSIYQSREMVVSMAALLIIAGALFANHVFNRHEFHNIPVFVPALLYAMLGTTICLVQLSMPVLLANIFVLAGLNRQLRIFRQTRVLAEYFECGFWYGLAAVLFPPYLVLAIGLWISTIFTRAFHWREHVLPIISFTVPFLYWIAWKYWNHDLQNLVLFRKVLSYDAQVYFHEFDWINNLFILFTIGVLVAALPRYLFLADRASNKARGVKNIFIIIAVALCSALLIGYVFAMKWVLLPFLLPLTFIIGYWFTNYRYSLIAPLAFYLLCLCTTLAVLHFYNIIGA